MFKKYINNKINEYLFEQNDKFMEEKIQCLNNYLPNEIMRNIKLYLRKKDIDNSLLQALKNHEPYEIMNEIVNFGGDIQKVYNEYTKDYDKKRGINRPHIHPDLIPFLIDNNIIISDELHYEFTGEDWGFNHEMNYGLIKSCLEYKIADISNKISKALSQGNIEYCEFLIKWNNDIIYHDKEFKCLLYSAISSWTIHSLIYLLNMRSDLVDPYHIIYAGYHGTYQHFHILLHLYLEHKKEKFVIDKKISDHILQGLCGFYGIQLLKDKGFNILEYDNILKMKETNTLPEPTIKRGITYFDFPSASYSNKFKNCFNMLGIPKGYQ